MDKPEIFISYGWGGESERVAITVYSALKDKEYNIIRDKINLRYKGNIKQFMQRISRGKFIIVIISDKYLKSENCMYEMLEIKRNRNVYKRIFPIVLTDAKIYDELDRIEYLNYWDDKVDALKQKTETLKSPVGKKTIFEKIDQYADISRVIGEITDMLRDMNTLTPEIHQGKNFQDLVNLIDKKYTDDYDAQSGKENLDTSRFIGKKINNYVITDYIHSGGFGSVYKAQHIHLDKICAIKISHQITRGYRNLKDVIAVGLNGLRLLNHPNIVRVEDVCKMSLDGDTRLVIVMEFISGGTLKELAKDNLSKEEINGRLKIFKKICDAIQYAHTKKYRNTAGYTVTGLMHGDIKPGNVLLTEEREPKVMDFMFVDLHRLLEIETKAPKRLNFNRYATMAAGTPGYMSPEQEIQGEVNEQTDIYALGILLFEIFSSERFADLKFKDPVEIETHLKTSSKHIPNAVPKIIHKATQRKPEDRFLSVNEIILALDA
jgi:hypothetical protein